MHGLGNALVVAGCTALVLAADAGGQERTVASQVYSAAQAARGKTTFDAKCASCHDGGSMGPDLQGAAFLAKWDGKKIRALYDVIVTTMPADAEGSLTAQEGLELVAQLLRANQFAAGDQDLAAADLNQIVIARK